MSLQPDALLARHAVLRTRDVATFHAYIAGMEGHHQRYVVGPGPVEIELRHVSLGRVDLGLVYSSVALTVERVRQRSDAFLVQFPLDNSFTLETDSREIPVVPGTGVVISPGQAVRRAGRPGWILALSIANDFLRLLLSKKLSRPLTGSFVFRPLILASVAAEIRGYALLMANAIDHDLARPGTALTQVLESGLVDLLLELQPHSHGREMAATVACERGDRVQAVEDYLNLHLPHPLTVEQLAAAADCSVRSLQMTFVEICGMSPMEWVRSYRLVRARKLLEQETNQLTVAEVARCTGFPQLGRFAACYKAKFGELPSETIRRRARKVPPE